MLKKGTLIKGKCTSYSNEGEGVIHLNKEVIFVKGLIVGEEVDILINYNRAGINYGSIKKIHSLSKDRVTPKCKVATACGGCAFQSLSYHKQLEYKTSKVKDAFKYIAKLDVKVNNCIGMYNPYYYRNKSQTPVKKIGKKIVTGFYKAKSHDIVPIDECVIEDKRSNKIINSIKKIMSDFKIEPYDEDRRYGIIRHILIRTSLHFNEIMVVLVTNCDSFPSRNNFINVIKKENPEITTIVQNINKRDTNVILGEQERILFGKGYIVDSLCGIKFRISSKSFFQINPVQTEKLYNYIKDNLNLKKNDTLLDAYSGVGTIGMSLASKVKEVISVEIEKSAVKDAIRNAKENKINNIKFICDDASRYINELDKLDVLVMDPPRKGSTPEFLKAVNRLKPTNIIYVSCDPNTLARDINYLKDKYIIKVVQPFDMFPMTYHIETVMHLVRR
ncbi:MAG: 23S rRNA (uracil(1939)-C(5))-methyltransferase RlmD [Bacilli bacterium]|nr:23S rRNA (uracil(1939)-C(5))-methyltransferase RlmD [Bacilli bacterium]